MKRIISLISLSLSTLLVNGQSLEEKIAASACKNLDSIPLSSMKTPQEKKKAIRLVFVRAVASNQNAIKKDSRFGKLNDYDLGKQLGTLMGQKIIPILSKSCPKFSIIVN